MARGKFIAEEIDFEKIKKGMAALEPPKLALEEVLSKLRPSMHEQRKRGVTVEQLVGLLKESGIEVGVRNLKHFIDKGELLGGRPKRGRAEEDGPGSGERSGTGQSEGTRASAPAARSEGSAV